MHNRLKKSLRLSGPWLGLLLAGLSGLQAADRAAKSTAIEERLRRDVTFLASDECEGRGPGTEGIEKAAQLIAADFKKAGLKPAGDEGSYFQAFTIPSGILDEPAQLALEHRDGGKADRSMELRQGKQFWPMGLGEAGKADAGVVFAGYGITSSQAEYDDYAPIDADGKVVIVLRGAPRPDNRDKAHELYAGAPFVAKINNAAKHGAVGLLVVNGPDAGNSDPLLHFSYTALERRPGKLPTLHVKRSVLEAMIPGGAEGLRDIEGSIPRDLKPRSRELKGWRVKLNVHMHRGKLTLKNVIGTLPGKGPLAEESVVVGAHYDHLGYGGVSSLARLKDEAIHHGADDNASGTTLLLELVRRFATMPERTGRRLVFAAFSGEELGLFGSQHYCKNPPFPLEKTAAMFNMDMVGRLRVDEKTKKERLLTEGSGTAALFPPLLERMASRYDLHLVNKKSGLGPSDHASFCSRKVPVLFIWTGSHADYHCPSDTADKLNVAGMRMLCDLAEDVVSSLATVEKRPEFVVVKEKSDPRPAAMPVMRIRPDYSDEKEGVLLEAVTADGPAERAGLKAEDRIIEMAGKPVSSLEAYMAILAGQRKGDVIDVGILRKGKKVTLKVKLE